MINDLDYKKELIDWFKQIYPSLNNPFAITLTKPNTHYSHQSQIKHFMNKLNKKLNLTPNKKEVGRNVIVSRRESVVNGIK